MKNDKDQIKNDDLRRFSGRAKSRKEIALEYGISTRTLQRWFKKKKSLANLSRELIPPVELVKIYKAFGLPEKTIDD